MTSRSTTSSGSGPSTTRVPDAGAKPSLPPRRTTTTAQGRPAVAAASRPSRCDRRAVGPVGLLDDDGERGRARRRSSSSMTTSATPVGAVLRVDPVGLRRVRAPRRATTSASSGAIGSRSGRRSRQGRQQRRTHLLAACRARCRAARAAGRAAPGRRSTRRRARPAARAAGWRPRRRGPRARAGCLPMPVGALDGDARRPRRTGRPRARLAHVASSASRPRNGSRVVARGLAGAELLADLVDEHRGGLALHRGTGPRGRHGEQRARVLEHRRVGVHRAGRRGAHDARRRVGRVAHRGVGRPVGHAHLGGEDVAAVHARAAAGGGGRHPRPAAAPAASGPRRPRGCSAPRSRGRTCRRRCRGRWPAG